MGTPGFAIPSLERLTQSSHHVVGVVTVPDKPKGRGQRLSESAIKKFAKERGLKVLTPGNLKDESFVQRLRELKPDLIVVVAFRILPEEVFSLPPLGTINLHASLLPRYRGAAPINWAIMNGETKTGLTTFYIRKKVDTGDVILQREMEIGPEENFGELHDRMAVEGAEVSADTVELIERGEVRHCLAHDKDLFQFVGVVEELLFSRSTFDQVNCRVDASVREASVEHQLHVPCSLEFFKDHLIHSGACFDEGGGDNRERSSLLDITGGTEKALRFVHRIGVDPPRENLP